MQIKSASLFKRGLCQVVISQPDGLEAGERLLQEKEKPLSESPSTCMETHTHFLLPIQVQPKAIASCAEATLFGPLPTLGYKVT